MNTVTKNPISFSTTQYYNTCLHKYSLYDFTIDKYNFYENEKLRLLLNNSVELICYRHRKITFAGGNTIDRLV